MSNWPGTPQGASARDVNQVAALGGAFGLPAYENASATINPEAGVLFGFLCSTSSSGTIDLYDGLDTSGTHFVQGFTVTAGQFTPIPCAYKKGLYAGMANCTGTFIFA